MTPSPITVKIKATVKGKPMKPKKQKSYGQIAFEKFWMAIPTMAWPERTTPYIRRVWPETARAVIREFKKRGGK